ncbi:MAG: hypothetical protein WAM14_14560 [Candidatus Nitrosopolaris sp.]
MMHWRLTAQFERPLYYPSENAVINLWFVNTGFTTLDIKDILLQFDFGLKYSFPSAVVTSRNRIFLGKYKIKFPQNVVDRRFFNLSFKIKRT